MHDHPERYSRKSVLEYTTKLLQDDFEELDAGTQWRKARAAFALAQRPETTAAERKELYAEALRVLRRAVRVDPSNSDIRRWLGVLLLAHAEYQSGAAYVGALFEAKDAFLQAVELNPHDAQAYHRLGRWASDLASFSWWYRTYLSWFALAPPQATLEDARGFFVLAEHAEPGIWKANALELARVYQRLAQPEAALRWCAHAVDLPVFSREDKEAHRAALALLKSLDAAAHKKAVEERQANEKLEVELRPDFEELPAEERAELEQRIAKEAALNRHKVLVGASAKDLAKSPEEIAAAKDAAKSWLKDLWK